ncbi:PQQ-dependent sugar dehydrogenase [Xylophilus sp. Leaf220]|uniref:PQQ-dependent sugar dehydrogenase n=1 Tax=Xylophilus sp. Leaf220 TaxID=1735686 RepID=UPI0012E1E9DB
MALATACLAGPAAAADAVKAVPVAQGLSSPWAVAFLPGGKFLVTERPGQMRIVSAAGEVQPALQGVPAVAAAGQGGLLDVVTDSGFAANRALYFCYSEANANGTNGTALARAVLSADERRLEQVKVLFRQQPKIASSLHFGCRIVEKADGTLWLTLGERSSKKEEAQNLKSHLGKIVRIAKDGTVPPDNPFVGRADALPEIWSWGHRNAQGATLGPDGRLWMHEHGPQGGDEINVPVAGRNYGWPVITYGENYGGGPIGRGITQQQGMEQPLHYWVPSIAPSGMAFLTGDRYGPAWKGSLFVGSLKFGRLHRLQIEGGKVAREEFLLESLRERIRDVRQGPDGWLYVLTDGPQGRLLRLEP